MNAQGSGFWRTYLPLLLIVAVAAVGLLGYLSVTRNPAITAGTLETSSGGLDGLRPSGPFPEEPDAMFVTPKGRQIPWGTVDELGFVMPLDVRRPRPEKPSVLRPTRGQIAQRRELARQLVTSNFPEVRIGPDDGHTHNETSIDLEGDTLVAGWNQFGNSGLEMGVGRSIDRGQSWSWSTLGGFSGSMSDPMVKSGGGGRWYFGYIASGGSGGSDYEVYVQRSDDDGATWQSPVAVTNNGDFDDKPYFDASGDEVLVGYADFGFSPARVRAARSLDGGLTFGSNTILSTGGGNGALPVIAPNGDYYVFWRGSAQEFLWMSKSVDQGTTWSSDVGFTEMSPLPSTLPGQSFRMINIPSAAADPVSGDLLVVWNDQIFGNPDIVAVHSDDGGATWSAPVRVNDDAGSEDQFFPWVTFDEAGVAYTVWYDQRQNGTDIDVYLARSTDRGATWEPNIRVTAASFTPVLPWEGGAATFIGDYNAVAAAGGDAFPFYQDARAGVQDVYVSTVNTTPACGVDADCDDGLYCNGAETCVGGLCQAGNDPCGGGACDEAGDLCTSVCGDATCDPGEDCSSCATDCPSFPLPAASCGNGLCEAGDGEDCVTCAQDCNGVQGGKPSNRFCCGFGGSNPVGCGSASCTTGGFGCTEVPQGSGGNTCCGDLVCESPEDSFSCALDCGAPAQCGDGTCDAGEDSCSCSSDCGAPPGSEVGLCSDGIDNDCDLAADCADVDCAGDATCQAVDCSQFGSKNACNAEASCRWDNKNKVCIAN